MKEFDLYLSQLFRILIDILVIHKRKLKMLKNIIIRNNLKILKNIKEISINIQNKCSLYYKINNNINNINVNFFILQL